MNKLLGGMVLYALLLTSAAGGAEQVRVVGQVDTSSTIYVDESFSYHVIIDGDNSPGEVDLSSLSRFKPQHAGNRDLSRTSVTRIGGKTTRSETKRYVMSYSLVSSQQGRVEIPPVTVTVGGKRLRTNPVTVNVVKPGTTDKLDLQVRLSEEKCYVGQPIVMSVKLYISASVEDLVFNIPIFHSDRFTFEDPDTIDPSARQMLISARSSQTAYVTQKQTTYKGKNANVISFDKVVIPKSSGMVQVASAFVSADVAVGRKRRAFGYENIYDHLRVDSKAQTLEILPLPDEGKPDGYYGLVGGYNISASAEPRQVSVGEPITLTIRIGGNRYLKAVRWPELEKVPGMAENFKIPTEHSPPVVRGGAKVFTQTIRASNEEVTEVPAIGLAYFDAEQGRYVTVRSEPIKLEVTPTKILTTADFEGRDFAVANREIEAIKQGLSANYTNLDALTNESFSVVGAAFSGGYAALWMVPFIALVVSSLVRLTTHTSADKAAVRRRRSALRRASKQLKKVSAAEREVRAELLGAAMKQYIGERFEKSAASLTSQDCYETIVAAVGDEEAAERYREVVADCEAATFAGVEADVDEGQVKRVSELMRRIEKKVKK